jgi:hypothetical protein
VKISKTEKELQLSTAINVRARGKFKNEWKDSKDGGRVLFIRVPDRYRQPTIVEIKQQIDQHTCDYRRISADEIST